MKKINTYIGALLLLFAFGCSDDFLERIPEDKQTELTAFKTNENFETYSWGLYDILYKSSYDWSVYGTESNTDNMFNRSGGISNWELADRPTPTSGGGWGFTAIKKVNLMLDNIDGSDMGDEEKNHY